MDHMTKIEEAKAHLTKGRSNLALAALVEVVEALFAKINPTVPVESEIQFDAEGNLASVATVEAPAEWSNITCTDIGVTGALVGTADYDALTARLDALEAAAAKAKTVRKPAARKPAAKKKTATK